MDAAVTAALGHGLEILDRGHSRRFPPPPAALLVQARLAARNGVTLDSVVRRYCAGQAFLADLIVAQVDIPRDELQGLLRTLAAGLDELLVAVGEEYRREVELLQGASGERLRLVEGLLAGRLLDAGDLRYDLEGWHIALVAPPGLAGPVRDLAKRLDRALLLVQRDEVTCWMWVGGRRKPGRRESDEIESALGGGSEGVGMGEPARGREGWRQSHRQAVAIQPLARGHPQRFLRYGAAPLLAATLRDRLLASSLQQLYLVPLEADRDGGEAAKATLRAYFAAGGNASAAAAALGVSRRTVSTRLGAIEDLLGQQVSTISAELQTSLLLEQLAPETAHIGGKPD
ncbi:MAG: helix-turn-helix domain-containing protein [Solirubrobacterales bacterium]